MIFKLSENLVFALDKGNSRTGSRTQNGVNGRIVRQFKMRVGDLDGRGEWIWGG